MNEIMPFDTSKQEIFEQPHVFKRVFQNSKRTIRELAKHLVDRNVKSLILLGSGDSYYAGLCTKFAFEEYAGINLNVIQAYEFASFGSVHVNSESAVIIISSSGRISTTRDALAKAKTTGAYIIGITDNEFVGNPFIEQTDFFIVPGAKKSGWPTQTTSSTIGILIELSIFLGFENKHNSEKESYELLNELDKIPNKIQSVLDNYSNEFRILTHIYQNQKIIFLGSGPGFGVANIGTALMAEGPGIISTCFYIEEFFHALRTYSLEPGDLVILIAPNDSSIPRYEDVLEIAKRTGIYLVVVTVEGVDMFDKGSNLVLKTPLVPVPMNPLLAIIMVHRITISFMEKAIQNGYMQPDFRFV
jgi:glucosamine--fructose-6-phosphate aminotransferase (isomerizing)